MIITGRDFIENVCKALDIDSSRVTEININAKYGDTVAITVNEIGDERLYSIIKDISRGKK